MSGAPDSRHRSDVGPALLEREAEQAALAAALETAEAGDGRVVAVTGQPGVGKTGLLSHARALCVARGFDVLTATASPLERDLAHGVSRQLLLPALRVLDDDERAEVLGQHAELAGRHLLGGGAVHGGPVDFVLLDSLYWTVAALADRAPLALLVDDAHWADDASLRWVDYLARRLDGLRLLVVASFRPTEPGAPQDLLDRLATDAHVELSPAPLGLDACGALASRLRGGPSDDAFAAAVHRATGGNALLVHELLRSVRGQPVAGNAVLIDEVGPSAVARTVRRRLDGQTADVVTLARSAAVLGDGTPLARVLRYADLEPAVAYDALGTLALLDILAPGQEVRFVHPVVRDALVVDLSPAALVDAHHRAASLLTEEGATPAEVARHLLRTPPAGRPETVDRLRAAAADAATGGDHAAAARLLRRALEEPPAPEQEVDLLWAMSLAELLTDTLAARSHLARLSELDDDPLRRAEAALLHAVAQLSDEASEAEAIATRAAAALDGRSEALDRELRATAELAALLKSPPRPLDAPAPLLEPVAADEPGGAFMGSVHVYRRALAGEDAHKVRVAVEDLLGAPRPPAAFGHLMFATIALVAADAPGTLAVAETWLDEARRSGSAGQHGAGLILRADAELARGDLADAAAAAEAAIETFATLRIGGTGIGYARSLLLAAQLEQGDLVRAVEVAAAAERDGIGSGTSELIGLRRWAPSMLAATGDLAGARVAGLELGHACETSGIANPALVPWRSEVALVLRRADAAADAAALAQEEVELAQAWGAPRAVARALRVAGWVRDDTEQLEAAERAVEDTPFRLERARCAIALGAHHRRRGRLRAARGPLGRGAELADLCGARPLVQLAREELAAAGARPRRQSVTGPGALTSREARATELAAEGLSNRDIAQTLFVTQRTVELHLSNAYRKLGISTRAELAAALGPAGPPGAPVQR